MSHRQNSVSALLKKKVHSFLWGIPMKERKRKVRGGKKDRKSKERWEPKKGKGSSASQKRKGSGKERRKSLQTLGLLFDQMGIAKVSLGAHRPIVPSFTSSSSGFAFHWKMFRKILAPPLRDILGCHRVPDICDQSLSAVRPLWYEAYHHIRPYPFIWPLHSSPGIVIDLSWLSRTITTLCGSMWLFATLYLLSSLMSPQRLCMQGWTPLYFLIPPPRVPSDKPLFRNWRVYENWLVSFLLNLLKEWENEPPQTGHLG